MTPRENPHFFGHHAAIEAISAAMAGARLHHAWIIAGPEGVGKATLAYRFARCLLAGRGRAGDGLSLPSGDPVFRRVAAGTHADLLSIEREWDEKKKRLKKNILADDARAVAPFLQLTPAEGGARVVVVDGAEDLNKASANALLKILEEPPPRAYLLLVTAAPGRLLPTLRSRCRIITLGRLGGGEMEQALGALGHALAPADMARTLRLARGAPGRAEILLRDGGLRIAELVDEVLAGLPRVDMARAYGIADALREEAPFGLFMELLAERVADLAAGRLPGGALGAQGWAECWASLRRLGAETERANMDRRQAVVAALALLRGA